MSFLHGVLHSIQPKLGQHKGTLTSALTSLKNTNDNGISKYKAAIAAVEEWVRRYNNEVAESNRKVAVKRYEQKTLDVEFSETALSTAVKVEHAEKSINAKLQECQEHAKKFTSALDITVTDNPLNNAINDLNAKLKDKLESVRRTVAYEGGRLGVVKVQEEKVLEERKAEIKRVLEAMKCSVDKSVGEDITRILAELKRRVEEILEALKQVSKDLGQYVIELQTWMESAKKDINDIKNTDLKRIYNEMNDSVTGKKRDIEDDAAKLVKWKEQLDTYINVTVKPQIAQLVETATQAVKQIDAEIKKDLGRMEKSITEGLKPIVEKSGTFLQEFQKTRSTLQWTVQGVYEDILNLWNITVHDRIKDVYGSTSISARLLQFIGKGKAFEKVTTYFQLLDSHIMQHVKGAMTKLGNALGNGGSVFTVSLGSELTALHTDLEALQNVVNGEVEELKFDVITGKLKTNLGIELKNIGMLNLGASVSKIQDLIPKLGSPQTLTHGDLQSLLTDLANIAEAVSNHSAKVVKAVIDKIIDQVRQEIQAVVGAIGDKTLDFSQLVTDTNEKVTLKQLNGVQSVTGPLSSLPWLVKKFKDEIHTKLTALQSTTLPGVFKKNPPTGKDIDVEGTLTDYASHKTSTLTPAVEAIKGEAASIFVGHITQGLTAVSDNVTKHLKALCDGITEAAKGVEKKLTEVIDDKIGNAPNIKRIKENTLQKIHHNLDKLQKRLECDPIKNADEFIKYVEKAETHYINELKRHTKKAAEDACNQLTTHARRQYVEALKFALQQFAEKVTEELRELPKEISDDLDQGHKKFMTTFHDTFLTKVNGIKEIKSHISLIDPPQYSPLSQATKILNAGFENFFQNLQLQEDFADDFKKVADSKESLAKLLDGLTTSEHFDKRFTRNLEELDNVLGKFKPSEFGEAKSPLLLESLRHGFTPLVTELKKAYVNCYSGRQWYESEQGRYAKVFCSITPILHNTLEELKEKLESEWKEYKIYNPDASHHSLHKLFFRENGYDFGLPDDVPNGELNHRADCTPGRILSHLTGKTYKLFAATRPFDVSSVNGDDADNLKIDVIEGESLLEKLYSLLHDYFNVCHTTHIAKPRTPCNVYEMLLWCSGLQFNSVYHPLLDHVRTLFPVDDESQPPQKIHQPIVAYPHNFTREDACSAIEHVSENAYLLLTGILGTGDAECNYASDFSTNFLKLKYPSRGEDCLHTLLDILRRLFPVLNFMHTQCTIPSKHCGWRDCLYGNGVGPSSCQCKEHSNTQPTDQPNSKPTCQANTKPNCQPTSPLMSYLNDCLPGHLPHRLESVGLHPECRALRLWVSGGFSGSTKTGKDICRILGQFFSDIYLPTLFTLVPKPPKTLPEHFGFALSLANVINDNRITNVGGTTTFKNTFIASIDEQSIELCDEPTGLTDALTAAYSSPPLIPAAMTLTLCI
ncbi:hypothetical protein, conserved [Babesia ovata]|uniref:Extracellular matrix-binding ebh n=1 Tax=Babesia ovata TaxID=189622 RepID=A0A2H6KJ70_9APIC|nr:uncharacterized protein BOVATA_045120 [Babesia ovata]GBE63019.1 hypothetical protein, conserved [Babesia ovata]